MFVVQPRRFTVHEYHRMSELGILTAGERTELIDGQILTMAAKGTAHSSATNRIKSRFELGLFERNLTRSAIVRVQDPIHLSDHSEPEPDIVLAVADPLDYSLHHPTAAEVLLLIEVADSSLRYDLEVKASVYAQANIADYWVVDVVDRQLHLFRQPATDGYQLQMTLAATFTVTPIAFPDWTIEISDLLPPMVALDRSIDG